MKFVKNNSTFPTDVMTTSYFYYSECVTLLNSAIDFVKNVQPKKLLPVSGKLKREVSMEEIIQLTDELGMISHKMSKVTIFGHKNF